ncbi:hypothetical protein [Lachnobacterium bovis]|uniref:Uncharacterized protein n=1 Tax=Lachnobacterium bovis TaxID=140626 RepID=A0A1H9U9W7_9FIRM|nr:hypothetical protein [Lachnobacterium bovis]SES06265.1 hypothetical protein SAMN02910429_02011 [Lachnobacterium bovis]
MKNRYRMKRESNKGQREKKNRTVHIYTSDSNIEETMSMMKSTFKMFGIYLPLAFAIYMAIYLEDELSVKIFYGIIIFLCLVLIAGTVVLILYGIVWLGNQLHRLVIQVSLDNIGESYLMKGRKEIPLEELKFKAYRRSPLRRFDTIKGFRNGSKLSCVRICEAHMPSNFYKLVSDLSSKKLIINPTELKEFSPYYYKL